VFKSHRIVFAVAKKEKRVHVVYVRHASRRAVGEPVEYSMIQHHVERAFFPHQAISAIVLPFFISNS
jgi:hypothetical protein